MLGAIAQFETEIRAERQREGIKKAKQKGATFGAQRKLMPKQVTQLQQKWERGVLIRELMEEYGISSPPFIVILPSHNIKIKTFRLTSGGGYAESRTEGEICPHFVLVSHCRLSVYRSMNDYSFRDCAIIAFVSYSHKSQSES